MLEGIHPSAIRLFKDSGYGEIELLKSAMSESELLEKIQDVHLLGIRSKTQLTEKVLNAAHKLIGIGVAISGIDKCVSFFIESCSQILCTIKNKTTGKVQWY